MDDRIDKLIRELIHQKAQTKALSDELSWQGKTLSVFTVINTVFLPLSFFAKVGTPAP
jgi:hypothetical protein